MSSSLSSSPLKDYSCQVITNRAVGHQLYILTLRPEAPDRFRCEAGQFVMIDLPTPVFYFRRPMSVLRVHDDGCFDVFYKVHGQGTRMMAQFEPGLSINVLGPLGNTFTPPVQPETALLIGGGIGMAPMYMLASEIQSKHQVLPQCYYGVRSREDVGLEEEIQDLVAKNAESTKNLESLLKETTTFHLSSDDGSIGFHGNVGQLLKQTPERVQAAKEAYICGPTVMMKACAQLLLAINPELRVEVSLEEHMPCGTGACTGCVVFRSDQELPSKTCVDGPVFQAKSLAWDGFNQDSSKGEVSVCSR